MKLNRYVKRKIPNQNENHCAVTTELPVMGLNHDYQRKKSENRPNATML
jgi:hypothetical protein